MQNHQIKYKNHYESQKEIILITAENLFLSKGIKSTTLSDIAKQSRMMRSTLYKYFKNKDEILWELQHQKMQDIGNQMKEADQTMHLTAYQRYELFLDILYQSFLSNPRNFLFLDLFNETYQKNTISKEKSHYCQYFKDNDFGTGDCMYFLIKDFYDGSINPSLHPKETAISIIYGALGILNKIGNNNPWIPIKYGMDTSVLVQTSFQLLLNGIQNH